MSNSSEQYLLDLRNAYEQFMGAPDNIIEFRRNAGDENVPTELDILFFLPIEGPGEDNVTMVATAGMSSKTMNGPYERVELAFEFKGGCEKDDRELLAKQLAELAVVPFREHRYFAPNMALDGIHLHPFDNMTFALVTKWELLGDINLPGIQPPVTLLRLTPLYESEARLAEEIGDIEAFTRFRHRGMIPEDFERKPVV